jgi:predicted DNA-binding transcriptional regulator AlpA
MEQKQFMTNDEIGRDEIQQLTGATKSKVFAISKNTQYGFPKRKRLVNRCVVFDRNEVIEWISKNDLKTMVLKNRPYVKKSAKRKSFNKLEFDFLIREQIRPLNKIKKPAMHSLFNKYKPIKHKVVNLNDIHEQSDIRQIDNFAHVHDCNHKMSYNV